MIDICMALDQSVSPHTGVQTIQNTVVFWQAVLQPRCPYSLFLEHGSPTKTSISHTIPPATQAKPCMTQRTTVHTHFQMYIQKFNQ